MSLRSLLQRLFESEDTTNLRERVEAIEIGWRRLQEEWTEVYNKFRTLQLRVAKQVQRLDKDSSQEEPHVAGSAVGDRQSSSSRCYPVLARPRSWPSVERRPERWAFSAGVLGNTPLHAISAHWRWVCGARGRG